MKKIVLMLVLSAGALLGADKPATQAKTPEVAKVDAKKADSVPVDIVSENSILLAERKVSAAKLKESQAEQNFRQLQDFYKQAQAEETSATQEGKAAIEQAWLKSGLSKDEYTLDEASFTFKLKPAPIKDKP